jgi:hypothetical protein
MYCRVSSFSTYLRVRAPTGQVIDGLDKAVLSMKKEEHALVTIAPEYGFGGEETKRDLATVPANSKLIYEIELVQFVKVTALYRLLRVTHNIETGPLNEVVILSSCNFKSKLDQIMVLQRNFFHLMAY